MVFNKWGNSFPKWYLEVLGTYVSHLNRCNYCFDHHSQGVKKNLPKDLNFESVLGAIVSDNFEDILSDKYIAGTQYAKLLTLHHDSINEGIIQKLRAAGFDDGEILEVNQVVSYFNYVNRMVVGLGVNTDGDILGLSPNDNDDEDNWSHQ